MTRTMTYSPRVLLAGAALLVLATGAALARDDQPGPNHITRDAAIKVATDAGYKDVHDVDFDDDAPDGEWEMEAFDASGKKFDIEVNATTGKIARAEIDD